jgi:hypothetical protein
MDDKTIEAIVAQLLRALGEPPERERSQELLTEVKILPGVGDRGVYELALLRGK